MTANPIIWQPSADRVHATAMHRFMRAAGFEDYQSLYAWSVEDSPAFWSALCNFCDVAFDGEAEGRTAYPGEDRGQLSHREIGVVLDGDRDAGFRGDPPQTSRFRVP